MSKASASPSEGGAAGIDHQGLSRQDSVPALRLLPPPESSNKLEAQAHIAWNSVFVISLKS